MRSIDVLSAALSAVEARLCQPLSVDTLAGVVHCSASGLQKLFRYAFHCSVAEYIAKRRLTVAARALLEGRERITDIALDFQYASPEVFTRAFKRFWGVTPSQFRKTARFSELFPRFENPAERGAFTMPNRKPLDISAFYDELKNLAGTYVLSIDIQRLSHVNAQHGRPAGDLVIAEAFRRIESELTPDMLLFRTGGDEFAVITKRARLTEAEAVARRITARNGQPVAAGDAHIPLSLWVGVSSIPREALSYHRALELMASAVDSARKSAGGVSVTE